MKIGVVGLVPQTQFCQITTDGAAHASGVRRRRTAQAAAGAPRGSLTGEGGRSGQQRAHTDFLGDRRNSEYYVLDLCFKTGP